MRTRYQWDLAKLSPNEYYLFCTTGKYPLDVPNKPLAPIVKIGGRTRLTDWDVPMMVD